MSQTELETGLANGYPQHLEKLAVDLLNERGYDCFARIPTAERPDDRP